MQCLLLVCWHQWQEIKHAAVYWVCWIQHSGDIYWAAFECVMLNTACTFSCVLTKFTDQHFLFDFNKLNFKINFGNNDSNVESKDALCHPLSGKIWKILRVSFAFFSIFPPLFCNDSLDYHRNRTKYSVVVWWRCLFLSLVASFVC